MDVPPTEDVLLDLDEIERFIEEEGDIIWDAVKYTPRRYFKERKNNTKKIELKKEEIASSQDRNSIETNYTKSDEFNKEEIPNSQEDKGIERSNIKSDKLNKKEMSNLQEETDNTFDVFTKKYITNLQEIKSIEAENNKSDEIVKVKITSLEKEKGNETNELIEASNVKLCDKIRNLKVILQSLQCPFSWKLDKETTDCIVSKIIDEINQYKGDGLFQFREFILTLVLCHEYYRKKDIDSAFCEIRKCKAILNNSDAKGYFEAFFNSTRNALLHIVLTCECYLYLEKNDLDEAKRILGNICKEENMDNPCKAAIWGIKAAVSKEYGYEGTEIGVDYVKEALKLDSKLSEWHFLLGNCLRETRWHGNPGIIPTREELKAFEDAVNISRNPLYIVYLAQAYRETTQKIYIQYKSNNYTSALKEKVFVMNERSSNLFKEAMRMQGGNACIYSLCARGFCKLPPPYRNIEKSKECCEKALRMAPDHKLAHQVRGNIYDHYENDYENAKKHYEKSGIYGAFMDLLKLEYKMNDSYNPIPLFEHILEQFTEEMKQEETISQMGSYCFYIKKDLPTAFTKYWHDIIKQNPHSDKLKSHRPIFVKLQNPVNIYEEIHDEARFALRSNNSNCVENVKLFQEMIDICCGLFPELKQRAPITKHKFMLNKSDKNFRQPRYTQRGREARGVQEKESVRGARFVPRNHNSRTDSRGGRNWRQPKNIDSSCE